TIDEHAGLSLVRDTLLFLWHARRRRIDTVINMEALVRYSSMLSYLSGACRRVGFHRFNQEGLYAGDLLTHKVLHNAHIHAAHTFLDLVHALDTPPDQGPRVRRRRESGTEPGTVSRFQRPPPPRARLPTSGGSSARSMPTSDRPASSSSS